MSAAERQDRIAAIRRDLWDGYDGIGAGDVRLLMDELDAAVTREEIEALPGYSVQIGVEPATYTAARLLSDIANLFLDKAGR